MTSARMSTPARFRPDIAPKRKLRSGCPASSSQCPPRPPVRYIAAQRETDVDTAQHPKGEPCHVDWLAVVALEQAACCRAHAPN